MTLKELLEKRAKLIADARAVYEKANTEKRDLTAEEKTNADKALDDADKLKAEIETAQRDEERERRLAAAESTLDRPQGRRTEPAATGTPTAKPEFRAIEWRDGYGNARSIQCRGQLATDEYRTAFGRYLLSGQQAGLVLDGEQRALQGDLPTAGGYIVAPNTFVAELIQAVDNEVFMRRFGTVYAPIAAGTSLGIPSLDADPADPTWISELAIGSEDSTMVFGKRELKPHPLGQFIKISKTLLRSAAISVDSIVRQRLAYKIGVVMENAFLNGTGAGQPLGVFTASAFGINTTRDVSTGNTTSSITTDGLLEAKYTLKAQYWPRAQWIFHRDAVKQIAKLKDGDGQYLWQPSVQQGQADRLLGFAVNASEYAPNTFTTALYVGILGDFSKYAIVDSLGLTIQVLMELYAATNQNGYIARMESDGMPTIEEAFVRVKLA